MSSSQRFFRYLPRRPGEDDWGAVVLDAGYGKVPPGAEYPLPGHPEDHSFSWEKGRRLAAYTFVYITAGTGVFDSEATGEIVVEAGSVFIVFPGVWHRYRPDRVTGWDEYWVEVEGRWLEEAVLRAELSEASPVVRVGHDDALLRCFLNIVETIRQEDPGFEPIIAMRSLEIVARIRSRVKVAGASGLTPAERWVRQAQVRMREALCGTMDFPQLAQEMGVSYSSFRRVFKAATGRAPGDYFIEMKMNRARQLLLADRSVQEVAYLLGFESPYYFSRLFKARTGEAPSQFRPRAGGEGSAADARSNPSVRR